MKRRTYGNFLKVVKVLQEEKHYTREESGAIARGLFDQVEEDRGRGGRPVEWFLDKIITREEWAEEPDRRF